MQLSKTGKVTCDRDDMTTVTATTKVIISNVEQQYISISATAAAGRRGDGGGGGIHLRLRCFLWRSPRLLVYLSLGVPSSSILSGFTADIGYASVTAHTGG